MSSVTSTEQSAQNAVSTSVTSNFERKLVSSLDAKLENRLTVKDLEYLYKAFIIEGDGYSSDLSLTKDQFCEALTLLLKKGTKKEYAELFNKIDIMKKGSVNWDQLASHLLQGYYERDDRFKSTQVPQWRDLKLLPSPHKEVVQGVSLFRNTNCYIAVSKEGCVSWWDADLKLQWSLKIGTDTCKIQDLWITDFVILQTVNKLGLALTSKEIAIYDLNSRLEFCCQYKVQGLSFTPLCLDYWSNPDDTNDTILVWGDVGGFVNILFFNSANIALFERPPAPPGEKQNPCLCIQLKDILSGRYKNACYSRYEAHKEKSKGEWVREVKYSHYLECFISCATTSTNAVVIGWMEKHSSGFQREQATRKEIQRISEFTVSQGVNDFDFSENLNLIATAGVNSHVCLWNPYVVSKPNGGDVISITPGCFPFSFQEPWNHYNRRVLRGHMTSIIQVHFVTARNQLISFSKDKVMRIWDVQLQVCIQRLAGTFPKGPEAVSTLIFDNKKDRDDQTRNRLFITFNHQIAVMEMKNEIKNRIFSHEKPVVAAVYNSVYNQIVSVCQAGTVIMWLIDTGQKVKQFNRTHGSSEVTCLSQDHSETRLYTGSTDGTIKVWDFNGHCYHSLECSRGQPADVGQVIILKRSVLGVGWAKYITIFRNNTFKEFHVKPGKWEGGQEHGEDILSCSFMAPNTLATGSYDGEIVIWNTNSELATHHCLQRSRSNFKSRWSTFSTTSVKENEFGWAVVRLIFLENRRGSAADGGANLVSCGGNGWVRFWNASQATLIAEFVAHENAGSIIMATDQNNQFIATADAEGFVRVWEIQAYAVNHVDQPIIDPPSMRSHFQPHQDQINSLEICQRNEQLLIISASSDCSVALYDINGNRIGICGQEEHWKIESYQPVLGSDIKQEQQEKEDSKCALVSEMDEASQWQPDERATTEPKKYRINTWSKTVLGKAYQDLRILKRERKQPGTVPKLPYLQTEKTKTLLHGPYSALEMKELKPLQNLPKPDAEKYFNQRSESGTFVQTKLPAVTQTLMTAFDEKSLFPSYVLEFEKKMKNYHAKLLNERQVGSKELELEDVKVLLDAQPDDFTTGELHHPIAYRDVKDAGEDDYENEQWKAHPQQLNTI